MMLSFTVFRAFVTLRAWSADTVSFFKELSSKLIDVFSNQRISLPEELALIFRGKMLLTRLLQYKALWLECTYITNSTTTQNTYQCLINLVAINCIYTFLGRFTYQILS